LSKKRKALNRERRMEGSKPVMTMARRQKPKPKPKPKKYTWILSPSGMLCHVDSAGGQTVSGLWEAGESSFHDADLARATKEINGILGQLEESNEDPGRQLGFIEVENRLLLVWASYDAVGPEDDPDTIRRALRLKEQPWFESQQSPDESV
jgi:hypothetical protein